MLNLLGKLNEDELVESARAYLPEFGNLETGTAEVPFKHNGQKRFVDFFWLAGQWVYIGLR